MASMVRGPIGGVLVTGVASSALLAKRQWRDFLIFGTGAAVVIAALFLARLGIAYLEEGSEFVDLTLSFQVGNRFGDPDSALDFYFFSALGSYALSYPLAVIALAALWGILALLALRRWSGQRQSLAILAIAAATILCVKYAVEEPGQARHYSSRAFIDQVERFRHEQGPFAPGFFAVGPDYDDLNYLVALNSPEQPRYFASLSQLAAASAPPPGILITPASRAAEFQQQYRCQWREIARGRLGHKNCVAVQLQEHRPAQPQGCAATDHVLAPAGTRHHGRRPRLAGTLLPWTDTPAHRLASSRQSGYVPRHLTTIAYRILTWPAPDPCWRC